MACKTKSKPKLKYATGGQMTKAINSKFLPTYIGGTKLYADAGWLTNDLTDPSAKLQMMKPDFNSQIGTQLNTNLQPLATDKLDAMTPKEVPIEGGNGFNMGAATAGVGAASGALGMISPLLSESTQNSAGMGAATGALKGASMGVMLGPIGMGVGAVLGGATGLLGAKKAQKEAQRAEDEMMFQRNSKLRLNELQPQQSYGSIMADGGSVPDGNTLLPEEQAMMDYYNAQGQYTQALQDAYPNIPINDILNDYASRKDFSLRNLDQYAQEVRDQYGDFSLNPQQIMDLQKQGYPDIMGISDQLKQYDMQQHQINDAQQVGDTYKYANTSGGNDPMDQMFGIRNMLQRSHPKGSVPYKYLQKAKGGLLYEYANGGIHIDPSKRGTFKAQASKMGMGVQEAASKILAAPEGKYSPAMRKKANFAKNFAKADGGLIYSYGGNMNITDRLSEIKSNTTHEQSALGGVPISNNALLEDKEFIYTMKNGGKFVFSNRF